ncbi:MAG: flippase [Candidatus Kerfeldbacteria bacterium]|nr:flippase [Candidatus Kerfeldbacteria bacterium]
MTSEPGVLARNTSYFTFALIAQKVISFLYFTFLARTLGPAAVGKYVLALSITTIFSVLIDLGLSSVLTREIAREPAKAQGYFGLVIGFKTIVSLIVVGLAVAAVNLIGYPELTKQLVYLACAVMVLDSFTLTVYSTLRGFHNLVWESYGTILMQFTVALTGWLIAHFTRDLRFFMAALIVAAAVNSIYALTRSKKYFKLSLRPIFNLIDWRQLAILAWPFALAAILTRIYGYMDSVLLSILSNDHAVGIYSVAYKITFALQFIPGALAASLFPGFSYYFKAEPSKLSQTFSHSVVYLTALAWPVTVGIVVLAAPIIRTIYPAYTAAILPLQILISSLVFLFISFPIGSLLPACNKQKRHTLNIGLAALINIIMNIFLVPRFGPTGAAAASLVSTVFLMLLGWIVVASLIKLDKAFLFSRLSRIALAGLVLALTVWELSYYLHFTLNILISGVIYVVVLLLIGGITRDEIKTLLNFFRSRPAVTT